VFSLGDLCEVGRDDRVLMSIFIEILLRVYSVIYLFFYNLTLYYAGFN
jgi:hypothetical protein